MCSGWGAWVIGMISDRQLIRSGAKQRRCLLVSKMHVSESLKGVRKLCEKPIFLLRDTGISIPRFVRCIRARRSPPNPPCCAPAPGMGSSGFPGQAPPLLFPRRDAATSGGRLASRKGGTYGRRLGAMRHPAAGCGIAR